MGMLVWLAGRLRQGWMSWAELLQAELSNAALGEQILLGLSGTVFIMWEAPGCKCPQWLRLWKVCLQCARPKFDPWKILWRRKWKRTPVFLPGNPMDRGAWWSLVHGVTRVRHSLATKPPPPRCQDCAGPCLKCPHGCLLLSEWPCLTRCCVMEPCWPLTSYPSFFSLLIPLRPSRPPESAPTSVPLHVLCLLPEKLAY